ncbi:2-keto-4-pentenoate hydratase/2-oxohepta-3-ene-1,7-dioic acid hydratase (catechol pathway) [Salipiger thiooxidans]|uniref:2-keto-4-pentenoate hydratase/2-oxohepta-3-ene-1,7-dioic acid hydratase (Catechol pathway) n=1 Tax=Salipiger thiooxidans TaxID=282683 RepID=A0A1G7FZF0_9RHOB|nr:fumarylacetoacetate hydrolase family protein [Salipiger thiooxidans]SDE81125.1 2-keto-4-pentenoate hydratase/2-oxohepta-3-ene-1,7-dioic acid hydratase (catechol pathway) [Salipiger thiooxidans]
MTERIATFRAGGRDRYGLVTEGGLVDLTPEFGARFPTLREVIEAGALDAMVQAGAGRAPSWAEQDVTFLPPIPRPDRIICVGVNFPDRNAEYKDGSAQPEHMSLFPRFPSSFTGHGQPLIRPPENDTLDYEGEIAVVIGKGGRRIAAEDAYDHIAALTLCNEGTIRDWVRHAKFNVTQGKNWDRSGALGPWLVPFRDAAQLDDASIETRVNGELRQKDALRNMMFPIRKEIAYISTFTTLAPGDIIVTGTPSGAGARFDPPRYLVPGDVIEVEAPGIGILRNTVADEC